MSFTCNQPVRGILVGDCELRQDEQRFAGNSSADSASGSTGTRKAGFDIPIRTVQCELQAMPPMGGTSRPRIFGLGALGDNLLMYTQWESGRDHRRSTEAASRSM
jgi:hypothetical protein